jgi:hypothetical protein
VVTIAINDSVGKVKIWFSERPFTKKERKKILLKKPFVKLAAFPHNEDFIIMFFSL